MVPYKLSYLGAYLLVLAEVMLYNNRLMIYHPFVTHKAAHNTKIYTNTIKKLRCHACKFFQTLAVQISCLIISIDKNSDGMAYLSSLVKFQYNNVLLNKTEILSVIYKLINIYITRSSVGQ